MTARLSGQPYLALVDDDSHSARLQIRMLLAHGAPSVSWLQGGDAAMTELAMLLQTGGQDLPGLVIVDLKSNSEATSVFIQGVRALPGGSGLLIAAMAQGPARDFRDNLEAAGADAVFERHADVESYRREAASIVRFWVRHQHLDAVGT